MQLITANAKQKLSVDWELRKTRNGDTTVRPKVLME